MIKAPRELGNLVSKEFVYSYCQPTLDKVGCIANIISCVKDLFKFKKDMEFSRSAGSVEASLLWCIDENIRIVCTTLIKKGEKKSIENHAFVHRKSPIPNEKKKQIGAFIDNRFNEPILLIQEKDL